MKVLKFISVVIALVSLTSVKASILDQSNDTLTYYGPGQLASIGGPSADADTGQSFSVGVSGILSSIEVYGWNQATVFSASRDHSLSLFVLGSVYTPENALASIALTANSYSVQWFTFDFSEFNLSVTQGEEYMMLWTTNGEFHWAFNSYQYNDGYRYIRNVGYPGGTFVANQDQIFRTYVTPVPIPPTLLLFISGIVSLITIQSGRNRNTSQAT